MSVHIGIVSKKAHARSHAQRLKAEGFSVELLGGSPSRLPRRCEVIVCRVASSSHAAVDLAQSHAKRGRAVIFEDGVTGILRELAPIKELIDGAAQKGLLEDRRPIHGKHCRGYYSASANKWSLRTNPPGSVRKKWNVTVPKARYATRAEAEEAVRKFDTRQDEEAAKPIPAVRKPEPKTAFSPYVQTEGTVHIEGTPPPEPKNEAPEDPMVAAREMAELLLIALQDAGIRKEYTFESLGLMVSFKPRHLKSPDGHACTVLGHEPDENDLSTFTLGDVTCPHCPNTSYFEWLGWLDRERS